MSEMKKLFQLKVRKKCTSIYIFPQGNLSPKIRRLGLRMQRAQHWKQGENYKDCSLQTLKGTWNRP